MNSSLIDTSVLVSYFNFQDSNHQKAATLFASTDRIVLLDHVVAETITVLKNKVSLISAQNFVRRLNDKNVGAIIFFTPKNAFQQTIEISISDDTLSFIDMLLIVLAKNHKFSLLTFDKEMIRISSE